MDFLEDLFDFGDRKHRKQGGMFGRDAHDDHYDEHDEHNDHHNDNHHRNYPRNNAQAYSPNTPLTPQTGVFCTRCSAQLVAEAKFCHQCGLTVEVKTNCASCGTNLPPGAAFCPKCGYKSS